MDERNNTIQEKQDVGSDITETKHRFNHISLNYLLQLPSSLRKAMTSGKDRKRRMSPKDAPVGKQCFPAPNIGYNGAPG